MSILVYYRDSDGRVVETSDWREGAPYKSGVERFGAGYSTVEVASVPGLQPFKRHVFDGTNVVLQDDQDLIDTHSKKKMNRESAMKKLEGLVWTPLTKDELKALFGR